MAIRHSFSFLLVPALLVSLTSPILATDPSSGPEDADLFKGESVDLYFYNQFFSFDMMVPGHWHVLSSKELIQLLRTNQRGDDFSDQNLGESGLFFLLSISKHEPAKPGPRGEVNPHMMMGAMDLSKYPGIKTGKDYGLHFQLMAGSKAEMTELEDLLKSLHFD